MSGLKHSGSFGNPFNKKIFTVAAAYAAPTSVNKYTASSPTGTCAAPAPVIDNVASSPATANAAPTPVSEYVAPTPAAFYAADLSLLNEKKRLLAAALAEADATPARGAESRHDIGEAQR